MDWEKLGFRDGLFRKRPRTLAFFKDGKQIDRLNKC
jgi:hypothetical protein